jgi:signal transduction histidine kinase/CheY-like chemotaxis protein
VQPGTIIRIPFRLHRRKDLSVFPVEITGRFFEGQGRAVHIAAIRDITERRRAEEERRKIEEQMRHTQKLESLGVLAGGIAHDFNNLLMAILGNTDLALLRLPPSAPARENLEEIVRASHRAADLCQQMLAYSGKGRFVVELLDLSAVVREMIHMLQVSISKKAVLRCDFAERIPAVEGDATQLRQVILNLITNASEALGEQSGSITLSTGHRECDRAYLADCILGADAREGPYVFVEVRDSGCGMDAATLPRIFDPFFTTKFTGRGLGLAAALGIVHGHTGALKVASEPGKGSTFTVLLPAAAGPAASPRSDQPSAGSWQGSGTVLLADDEEMIRAAGREMLEWLGFRVLTARDGVEALERFRDSAGGVVCVLLDLTMPRMNGDEAFQELRRIAPDVPVVLSSGYTQQDVARRFPGRGPAGFIQKPYTLDRLREVLRGVLG